MEILKPTVEMHREGDRKGKAQLTKMDVMVQYSYLDTRIKINILIKLIVAKLEYAR